MINYGLGTFKFQKCIYTEERGSQLFRFLIQFKFYKHFSQNLGENEKSVHFPLSDSITFE